MESNTFPISSCDQTMPYELFVAEALLQHSTIAILALGMKRGSISRKRSGRFTLASYDGRFKTGAKDESSFPRP